MKRQIQEMSVEQMSVEDQEIAAYWTGMSDDVPEHVARAPRIVLSDPSDDIAH